MDEKKQTNENNMMEELKLEPDIMFQALVEYSGVRVPSVRA